MFYRFLVSITSASGIPDGSLIGLYSSPLFTPLPLNYAWLTVNASSASNSENNNKCSLWIYASERMRFGGDLKLFMKVHLHTVVYGRWDAYNDKAESSKSLTDNPHDLDAVNSQFAYIEQGSGRTEVAELSHTGKQSKSFHTATIQVSDVNNRSSGSIVFSIVSDNIVVTDPVSLSRNGPCGWGSLEKWLTDHVYDLDVKGWMTAASTPVTDKMLEEFAYKQNEAPLVASHTLVGLVDVNYLRRSRILGFLRYSTYSCLSSTESSERQPVPAWFQMLWPSKVGTTPSANDFYLERAIINALRLFGVEDEQQFIEDPLAHPGPEVFAQVCGWLPGLSHYVGDHNLDGGDCDQFSHVNSFVVPGRNGKDCEDGAMALHDMAARLHIRARKELIGRGVDYSDTSELVRALLWVALCYVVLTHDCVASSGRSTRKDDRDKRRVGVPRTSERHQLTKSLCKHTPEESPSSQQIPITLTGQNSVRNPISDEDFDRELDVLLEQEQKKGSSRDGGGSKEKNASGLESDSPAQDETDQWSYIQDINNDVALHSMCRIYPVAVLCELFEPGRVQRVVQNGCRSGKDTGVRQTGDGIAFAYLTGLKREIENVIPQGWKKDYDRLQILNTESTDGYIATPDQDDLIASAVNDILGSDTPTLRTLNSVRSYREDEFARLILRSYSTILFLGTGYPMLIGLDKCVDGKKFDIGMHAMPKSGNLTEHALKHCCFITCSRPAPEEKTLALAHWFSRPWPRTLMLTPGPQTKRDLVPVRVPGKNTVVFVLSGDTSLKRIRDKYKVSEPTRFAVTDDYSVQAVVVTPK